jgi:DNA replication and repair protein RecF
MHLCQVELEEFRLYRRLSLPLESTGLRIVGENATGKSTLVEAIALLATMRSPRSGSDRELIHWQSGKELGFPPYARASGRVQSLDGETEIEIGLQVDPANDGPLKKSVKINGRAVRALDAVGRLKVVLFSPEDVALITGPPSGRRRYLDLFISQIDPRYLRSLARYNRILEQRNSLLKALMREGRQAGSSAVSTQLAFWNDEMVAYGAYIVARRRVITSSLAELVRDRFTNFSSGGNLSLEYRATVGGDIPEASIAGADLETTRDRMQRSFEQRLSEVRSDELRRGVSLAGPHRDDFGILLNGMEVGTYGSRGQQRLAVVALKLAEADQMHREAGEPPVILLDDVLSELDATHRERLLTAVGAAGAQLVLTSTDIHLIEQPSLSTLPMVRVTPGAIEPL